MSQTAVGHKIVASKASNRHVHFIKSFLAGILFPFGFAPFHFPGLSILSIALFFGLLQQKPVKQSFLTGFIFGIGWASLGVSWIFISIHDYGHLDTISSAFITFIFVIYLALFPALMATTYQFLTPQKKRLHACVLFSALWCLTEFCRAKVLGGFPWLLLGYGQMDSPVKYILPITGIYGAGFIACMAATFLAESTYSAKAKFIWIIGFTLLLLFPLSLKNKTWSQTEEQPLSVGIVQANLSMRDKWDESLFWQLMQHYQSNLRTLINKVHLIVLPESAIPLPASYVSDYLESINSQAKQYNSSILLGIPHTDEKSGQYQNTMVALGKAQGMYVKQHLVPFGEFIPSPFQHVIEWLSIPIANLKAGSNQQAPIRVHNHFIASLICYELAYSELLRQQLPLAELIVSISDDGWFGHSFAMYQQLQMAQTLSMQSARYQIVANNDGLSSIIDEKGNILHSLAAFEASTLMGNIYPSKGTTPWVYWGNTPILLICFIVVILSLISKLKRHDNRSP